MHLRWTVGILRSDGLQYTHNTPSIHTHTQHSDGLTMQLCVYRHTTEWVRSGSRLAQTRGGLDRNALVSRLELHRRMARFTVSLWPSVKTVWTHERNLTPHPTVRANDWRICIYNRRHWVWYRHWAKLQHCAARIAHQENCWAFILNGSSLLISYWAFSKITCVNFCISQSYSSKFKTISHWRLSENKTDTPDRRNLHGIQWQGVIDMCSAAWLKWACSA